jgi:hypothetical protein
VLKTIAPILFLSLALPLALKAQQPNAGVSPEWDIKKDMTALAAQIRQLQPMVDKMKPETWIAQGAPSAYVKQMASLQTGMQYLLGSAEKLAREPERLTAALDAYFRMQYVEVLINSLREGVRKYQSPDLAEILNNLVTESSNNKEKLRSHIMDLAAVREQEMVVMDQEAQRCRGMLSRMPVNPPVSEKRKNQKPEPK